MSDKIIYSLLDVMSDPSLREFMSVCDLFPVGDKVIVKVPKVPETSRGGIVLPQDHVDREQEMSTVGEIVALSRDSFRDLEPEDRPWLGTKVCFKKYLVPGSINCGLSSINKYFYFLKINYTYYLYVGSKL